MLELLLLENGAQWLRENVVCLSSSRHFISLSGGVTLEAFDFWTWKPSRSVDGFLPLAFVTKEKLSSLGISKYAESNLAIMSRHAELLMGLGQRWVASVSSGAVFVRGTAQSPPAASEDAYGFLKWLEESMLMRLAQSQGFNFSIGRLWAALGSYAQPNTAYAVVDFFRQYRETGHIRIHASHMVYRRYCDVSSFLGLLVESARAGHNSVFDSPGQVVEISEIASLVVEHFGGGPEDISRASGAIGYDDWYTPSAARLIDLANQFVRPERTLRQLVADTCEALASTFQEKTE